MNDHDEPGDVQQVPGTTPNFHTELAQKLHDLVPEAIADGKVDVKKLQELLDGDAADESERFGLFWPGKKRAMRAAQEPTTATLKPAKDESKDWDTTQNLFIEGDNLEVLKILQKHYHNKIKMIYIDPPYNTGKDFVYPDNYKEGLQSYLEFTKQVDEQGRKLSTNSDTDGRYHSNWLNMVYPRLKLARNLLTDNGVVVISIDDHEQDNLKKICNEVFGEDNFVAQLIWNKQHSQQQGIFKVYHEYLLVYSRVKLEENIDGGDGEIVAGALKKISRANPASEFRFPAGTRVESEKNFELEGTYGDNEKVTVVSGKFIVRGGKLVEPVSLVAGWTQKDQMKSWFSGKETIDTKGQRVLEFYFNSEGKLKCRKARSKITPPTLLPTFGMVSEQTEALKELMGGYYFDNPKPVEMIKLVASWFTGPDDLIMDPFSGSGTTAHALMLLNAEDEGIRTHIQIQLPEPFDRSQDTGKNAYDFCQSHNLKPSVAEITKERVRLAGEKIKTDFAEKLAERETPLDVGFRVYKLADTNFTKWQTSSDATVDVVQQRLLDMRESSKDAGTQGELLTEILLKVGLAPNVESEQQEIDGLAVWRVNDGAILVYLDEHTKPSLDQLRTIAATEPAKLIVLEDAFQGDDQLKTNLTQICKSNAIELWTV